MPFFIPYSIIPQRINFNKGTEFGTEICILGYEKEFNLNQKSVVSLSKHLYMMGMMAAMMQAGTNTGKVLESERLAPKLPNPIIPKGHKLFVIEGREIWALNRRNAIKKLIKNP